MATVPPACPTPGCQHPRLRQHCTSSTCTWWSCPICKGYGTPGFRWTGRLDVKAPPPG